MTSERIKEIQETTAYPNSVSVKQALLQVWNECKQEQSRQADVSPSLPLPHLCPAYDGECKEHLEPVYKCTECSGIFSRNDH